MQLLILATVASLFLLTTRFISVFPILYFLKLGHRASLLPSINLAQMSELSLVLASQGLAYGHITASTVSLITLIFVFTCITSTYMIGYSHQIQQLVGRWLKRLGFSDTGDLPVLQQRR